MEEPTLQLGGAATRELAPCLVVAIGARQIESTGASLSIGRAPSCDVRVDDPAVSAFHVELTSVRDGILVRDEGSRNGTFVDGVRLLHAIVPPGTVLTVGTTQLRIDRLSTVSSVPAELASFGKMRGASPLMRSLFSVLTRLAPTDLSVLIEGPTGTGKELVAQGLHAESGRRGDFVVLDCTAIPKSLAEAVLFGHERGAFTGADVARPGIFESAHGGTAFIDEIGDLPLDLQPKLLRALEAREVVRVGGTEVRKIDVRVLAATWRDLRKMVNAGTFREDLYFRIAQARVGIPALSSRPEDVTPLVYHFLQSLPVEITGARMIARDALEELKQRAWPGNVRELRAAVERAAMMAQGPSITSSDLGFDRMLEAERHDVTPVEAALGIYKDAKRSLVDDFERSYLERLVAKAGDNLSQASVISGIERHHLRDLLRKHGLRS